MTQISTEQVLAGVIRTQLGRRGGGLTVGRVTGRPDMVAVRDADGGVYAVTVQSLKTWQEDEEADRFASALDEAGVDNWEGYDHAREIAGEDPVDAFMAEWMDVLDETERPA